MADAEQMLHRIFDEIINEGRIDVADELFAEDFVGHGPMGDVYGRDAFKALVGAWRSAVPDVHCEIDRVIEDGDTVAWLVHATGTHTGGVETTLSGSVFTHSRTVPAGSLSFIQFSN